MNPLYVSYCSDGPYAIEIRRLAASLIKFKLDHLLFKIPDRGGWMANVHYRTTWLLSILNRYPSRPIVWLDADSEVLQPPRILELLDDSGEDFGIFFNWKESKKLKSARWEMVASVMFFKNNEAARSLLNLWAVRNAQAPESRSQFQLEKAWGLWKIDPDHKTAKLPEPYCRIVNSGKDLEGAVIAQYQSSRRFRVRLPSEIN